jgi:dihydroflavonol-4-reductase
MSPPTTPRGLVVVTGGSGYIAGYCIAQLLNEGWRVRTTVRNLGRAEEVRATIGNIAEKAGAIEFAAADLNLDAGWTNAVAGADYVLHVASPVPTVDPKSDDELVRPARDGTLRVLKASRDAGVKRVVMTSSISAIIGGRGVQKKPFTEADWTDETNRSDTSPYDRAKTIAERVAWAWHKDEGGALEFVAVNPSLVLGPVLGSDFSASLEAVRKLLDGSIPGLPHFGFSLVDVRDIAALQLLAMTTPSAAGQRFIGSCDFYWMATLPKSSNRGWGTRRGRFRPFPYRILSSA